MISAKNTLIYITVIMAQAPGLAQGVLTSTGTNPPKNEAPESSSQKLELQKKLRKARREREAGNLEGTWSIYQTAFDEALKTCSEDKTTLTTIIFLEYFHALVMEREFQKAGELVARFCNDHKSAASIRPKIFVWAGAAEMQAFLKNQSGPDSINELERANAFLGALFMIDERCSKPEKQLIADLLRQTTIVEMMHHYDMAEKIYEQLLPLLVSRHDQRLHKVLLKYAQAASKVGDVDLSRQLLRQANMSK